MNRRLSILGVMLFILWSVFGQATGTFRFAQLTDLHLTPNNPAATEDLRRSVEQINATDNIDFVLITGDLTKEGLIFALEPFTGRVLWKHKIGNSLINTVIPISRHKVLFTATSGEVGMLQWEE